MIISEKIEPPVKLEDDSTSNFGTYDVSTYKEVDLQGKAENSDLV